MRAEARLAVIGILALNLSVAEFVELQQLTPQDRKTRLHLPAACVPQMMAMKTGSRETDRIMVEVRCAEVDSQAGASPARLLPRLQDAAAATVQSR
jgi:hypothetical protein